MFSCLICRFVSDLTIFCVTKHVTCSIMYLCYVVYLSTFHVGSKNKAQRNNMKQFQFTYTNDDSLLCELEKIEQWRGENEAYITLWRIYSIETDAQRIQHICDVIHQKTPDALYLGCSTGGSISAGALSPDDTVLTCTLFERKTTRAELLQLPFDEDNVTEAVSALKAYCTANPWVRCVELHATMMGMAIQEFCDEMSTLPENIQVFGGGACNADPYYPTTYVFSCAGGFSHRGIVFLLLGGEDFHAYSTYICGWKSLKRRFRITKADKQLLFELDGEPAFNIYKRFLGVKNSDEFINGTTEFPLMMISDDVEILRNPLKVNDDGTIVMITDVKEGTDLRLAYGDPQTILSSIVTDGKMIADFRPDTIETFSCVARRIFWGDRSVSGETEPFHSVAPTSGFFSCSEFLRIGGVLRCFNMTLVLAAMREGEPDGGDPVNAFAEDSLNTDSEKMSLIRRFVSFIEASAAEFEDANNKLSDMNKQLTEANKQLAIASVTDGLTKLYNRAEIEKQIRGTVEDATHRGWKAMSLIMMDIDNFKRVNDIYGHKEGDRVIIALSDVLRDVTSSVEASAIGRWGGEEFMVMLPGVKIDDAVILAEQIRTQFADITYETAGCQTVSLGVTQALPGETADALYSRVDKALYIAKYKGRNRTVKLGNDDDNSPC